MPQELLGTARKTLTGFLDSSWICDEYNETASVRAIRNNNENQK